MLTINRVITEKRTDFSNVVFLLLLLIVMLLGFQSTGFVRFGGDDDNDGSGFGGTGRSPTFNIPGGESGFGGTGIKPFLGVNADNNILILEQPAFKDLAIVNDLIAVTTENDPGDSLLPEIIPSPIIVTATAFQTVDSSAIHISEAIQSDVDMNAKFYSQSPSLLTDRSMPLDTETFEVRPDRGSEAVLAEIEQIEDETATSTNWNTLSQFFHQELAQVDLETVADQALTGQENDVAGLARTTRRSQQPLRIQRPELPPVQRPRPIERLSVLPPRIQPMRL